MEFIEAQIPLVLHDAMSEFEARQAAAGKEYKYPQYDI